MDHKNIWDFFGQVQISKLHRYALMVGLLILCFPPLSEAAQDAWVKSNWAVIYADRQLSSPIGKVKQGRKLRVGEIKREHGTVIPIAIGQKIGYVAVADITFNFGEIGKADHQFSRDYDLFYDAADNFTDSMKENNHILLSAGAFTLGGDWADLSTGLNDSKKTASVFKLGFEHRPPYYRVAWSFHLGLYIVTQNELSLTIPTGEVQFNGAILKNNLFNLEIFGRALLSGNATVKAKTANQENESAVWGLGAGGELVLFPYSKFSFKGTAALQSLYFIDMPAFIGTDKTLNNIFGAEISFAISYLL